MGELQLCWEIVPFPIHLSKTSIWNCPPVGFKVGVTKSSFLEDFALEHIVSPNI